MATWQNLIAGRAEPSRRDGRFEVRAARGAHEVLADFPRSGPPEVERALAVLETAPSAPVTDVLSGGWRLGEELEELVAAALGFEPGESLAVEARRPARRSRRDVAGLGGRAGVALIAPSWNRLAEGALEPVRRELARGRAVLLVADERLPWIAADLGEALLEEGLAEERLAVLHGLGPEGWRAALAHPAVAAVRSSGERGRMARLRALGADRGGREVRLEPDLTGAYEVPFDAEPEGCVAQVVRRAFGRRTTFSGQTHGQVARVYCPEGSYSRFTECLLAHLEGSEAAQRPLPQVDEAALERARTLWTRGLDEGATLISGGACLGPGDRGRRLLPTVFANVEPRGGLALRPDPAPILALIRDRRRPGDHGCADGGEARGGAVR